MARGPVQTRLDSVMRADVRQAGQPVWQHGGWHFQNSSLKGDHSRRRFVDGHDFFHLPHGFHILVLLHEFFHAPHMRALVLGQVLSLSEAFVALVALKRLLARVRHDVVLKEAFLPEGFEARHALERLLSRVDPLVVDQMALLVERLVTFLALKRLFVHVDTHVDLEELLLPE